MSSGKDLCVLDKTGLRSARSEKFGKAVLGDLMCLIVTLTLRIWHQKFEDAIHG